VRRASNRVDSAKVTTVYRWHDAAARWRRIDNLAKGASTQSLIHKT